MYTSSGKVAQSSLFDEYLPMVHRLANKIKQNLPPSVEMDDLVQAGVTGLLESINRFDEGKGTPFSGYASTRIYGAMIDELRTGDWLPRSVRRNGRKMTESIRQLEQRFHRAPTEQEIAHEMEISIEEYQKLLLDTNCGVLTPFEEFSEEYGEPQCPTSSVDGIVDAINWGQQKSLLADAILSLPEREKQLLALYYQEELTMREIGAVFEVSEVRVCQIHSQAVNRLRAKLAH